ncbi:hypothetical protein Y032_0013g2008 [Ancylostoma ceylanicum]|uniref:Uncharacterized protein n=1 Tax=Ancylostoma ceylanicum TaxID=53326 RepID=A0A016VB32_9BILA|nr:hypothetical protein Y032_0013g2008 [Ancylostoma ceylanicum]
MEYEGDNAKKLVEEAVNAWKDKTRNVSVFIGLVARNSELSELQISPGTSFGCSTAKKDGKHKIVCVFE